MVNLLFVLLYIFLYFLICLQSPSLIFLIRNKIVNPGRKSWASKGKNFKRDTPFCHWLQSQSRLHATTAAWGRRGLTGHTEKPWEGVLSGECFLSWLQGFGGFAVYVRACVRACACMRARACVFNMSVPFLSSMQIWPANQVFID